MTEKTGKGLDLPERVRQSIASAVRERGTQARMVSTQGRESMRPPEGHIVAAATSGEIDGIRGPARIVRQLEFYKTFYGPVVRLAFTVYPMNGEPLSAATLLNVSQVSGDADRAAQEIDSPEPPVGHQGRVVLGPGVKQVPRACLHHHGQAQRGKPAGHLGGALSQAGAERVEGRIPVIVATR